MLLIITRGILSLSLVLLIPILFSRAKLKRTEAKVEEHRRKHDSRKAENYGFASMAAVPYAHIVAQKLRKKHPKGTTIELAPNPKDIVGFKLVLFLIFWLTVSKIWENMNKSDFELFRKKIIGFAWLAAVCFFNTVPLFIISILANLDTVCFWSFSLPARQMLIHILASSLCPFPGRLVKSFSTLFRVRLWCVASGGLRHIWFLPSCYHALAHTGKLTYIVPPSMFSLLHSSTWEL
jgi:hypothetical protein